MCVYGMSEEDKLLAHEAAGDAGSFVHNVRDDAKKLKHAATLLTHPHLSRHLGHKAAGAAQVGEAVGQSVLVEASVLPKSPQSTAANSESGPEVSCSAVDVSVRVAECDANVKTSHQQVLPSSGDADPDLEV